MATKKKVLVAEDEADILDILSDILEGCGAEILKAKDGVEALNIFQSQKVDALFTDLKMPNMNGEELIYSIREIDNSFPIIVVSGGHSSGQDVNNSNLRKKVQGFVEKPFNPSDIEEVYKKI
jgi:CheY-like chemotaxis protein